MSDGNRPNPAPNQIPIPTADQVIGEATSVLSTFTKDPVGAVRAAWDQKKISIALIVAVVFIITKLLDSVISGWGYSKFGAILVSWFKGSLLQLVLLAVLALVGVLLVHGHDNSGFVGSLAGVGTAAIPYAAAYLLSTVFLLIERIFRLGVIDFICGLIRAALGAPGYIALFILLALAIRRKTMAEDDFSVAKNTVLLAVAFFAANYVVWSILW